MKMTYPFKSDSTVRVFSEHYSTYYFPDNVTLYDQYSTLSLIKTKLYFFSVWGYSNLAVLIISLLAVLGAAFIPCMSGFVYEAIIQTMMALAVATLTGDAVLHLIPQVKFRVVLFHFPNK